MVPMATELVPVVDLRVLSQPDLDALAAASAHAVAPRSCTDADTLPPLKIDRAVFNESAGSRKQTFSRLRLAAAAAHSSPNATPASPSSTKRSAGNDPDNHLIAQHLRRLFGRDDPSSPPSTPPPPETLALPAPSPSPSPPRSPSPNPDRVTTNSKGVSVDLARLAMLVDPYDGELRRRTAGLKSVSELMGFINGLGGQWVSPRQRRKFVDAAFFGDHLPSGWKLQLGLKRKRGTAWVHCRRYQSPKGHQFATCKEVSAYLMTLLGYPEVNAVTLQHNSAGLPDSCDDNDDAVGLQHQIDSSVDNQDKLPVTAVTLSSRSSVSTGMVTNPPNAYECEKCNLTFPDQSTYGQHQVSFHLKSNKRRRKISKFGEPVVGKDGKIECPLCHKTFEEESGYFGHVGAHARHTPEAFLDKISSGKVVSDPLACMPFSLQELTETPEQSHKTMFEAGSHHQHCSNKDGGDGSNGNELFNTNCSGNFNSPNGAWNRPKDIPSVRDAPIACKHTNNIIDCAGLTFPKIASQSNDQLDSRINGLAEVTDLNEAGSYHAFRPTSFGSASYYKDLLVDRGMAVPKDGEVHNTVKESDVNLNSRLDTISFPIANANSETSTAFNEANQSSITEKCFSNSVNNNDSASTTSSCSGSNNKISGFLNASNRPFNGFSRFSASYSNDNVSYKAHMLCNKNNTMAHQSSFSEHSSVANNMDRYISSVATNVDCFASRSMHSKNIEKERAYPAKERMHITQNGTNGEAGFGVGAYNDDVFTGDITEGQRSLAQFNNNFVRTPNVSSHCSLPELNTPTAGNVTKRVDVNCSKGFFVYRGDPNSMNGSFGNRPISNNEPHGSVLEVMGKSSNNMHSRYNDSTPDCVPLGAANTSQNINSPMSMQANFGNMSSLVRSVGDVPVSSTTQDQCDLQLGFGAQKHNLFPGYGEVRSVASGSSQHGSVARHNSLSAGSPQFGSAISPYHVQTGSSQFGSMVRPNSIPPVESCQLGSMARQNFVNTSVPSLVLGSATHMGSSPSVQLGWDLNSSRMVTGGGMITTVCIWCNSQFHHFGPGQQVGNFGFICPACKDKVSQRIMPNNGL